MKTRTEREFSVASEEATFASSSPKLLCDETFNLSLIHDAIFTLRGAGRPSEKSARNSDSRVWMAWKSWNLYSKAVGVVTTTRKAPKKSRWKVSRFAVDGGNEMECDPMPYPSAGALSCVFLSHSVGVHEKLCKEVVKDPGVRLNCSWESVMPC